MWIFFGFDSTVGYSQDYILQNWLGYTVDTPLSESYGLGLHWSTIQTMCFLGYVSFLNLQRGGLTSLKEIWSAIKTDLGYWKRIYKLRNIRKESVEKEGEVVDGVRAMVFTGFLLLACIFTFEVPWVFGYNWCHFGDLLWPIYRGHLNMKAFGIWDTDLVWQGLNYIFYRNIGFMIGGIGLTALTLYSAVIKNGEPRFLYKVKFRKDRVFGVLALITVLLFTFWFYYPFTYNHYHGSCFPQTVYTYYDVANYETYTIDQIHGIWVENDGIHTLNIATKYMVFISLGYLFMVKVEKTEEPNS